MGGPGLENRQSLQPRVFDSLALRHFGVDRGRGKEYLRVMWKTLKDEIVPDIKAFIAEAAKGGQTVHIGTDSLQAGTKTQFVTVVVVLTPMKGGRVAYYREVVPRIKSLRERLLREVYKSTELALEIQEIVPGELTVHIDANPEVKFKSSQYVQELVGLVVGQGFKALIKPQSWAASHAADHIVRAHGKFPRAA